VILFFQIPFLPVIEDVHPRRNKAQQRLATLAVSPLEDLSSDAHFELALISIEDRAKFHHTSYNSYYLPLKAFVWAREHHRRQAWGSRDRLGLILYMELT